MGPLRSGHWEEISYVKDFFFEIFFEGKWGENFWMLRQLSDLGAAAVPVEGGGGGKAGRKMFLPVQFYKRFSKADGAFLSHGDPSEQP